MNKKDLTYHQDLEQKARDLIREYGYSEIVKRMDDEIREELHEEISRCSEIHFLTCYMDKHQFEFGETFDRGIFGG